MKNLGFIFIFLIASGILNAQISLTYSNHAFHYGDTNIMREASYVDEGSSGPNRIWDFSDLKCLNTTTSVVKNDLNSISLMPNSNFEVDESDISQFFNIGENSLQLTGIVTPDAVIRYDEPVVKMKYPFSYGDSFNGEFSGSGVYQGNSQVNIHGSYNVVADGFGTLILPNNVINNVLRVKSVTSTTEIMQCVNFQIETTKYIWYSSNARYPLLMITVVDEKQGNNPESVKYYAFYSENISASGTTNSVLSISDNIDNELNVYPNPFKSSLNLDYKLVKNSSVNIEVYNYAGEKIDIVVDNQMQSSGMHSVSFDAYSKSLSSGVYFIKFTAGNSSYLRKVIKTDN